MKSSIKFIAKKHDAEIILYGDIGFDITAKEFSDELKALGEVKTITVRIASHGGDYFEGIAMHSRLTSSGAKITVYIDGAASSAASVVAMAGDEIFIAEAGEMMIHEARVLTQGTAADLKRTSDRLESANEQMAAIYQRRTGQDMARIREMMNAETVFTASQAVELGFATATFSGERMAAKYDPERHPRKYPPSETLPPRRAEAQRMVAEMRMAQVPRMVHANNSARRPALASVKTGGRHTEAGRGGLSLRGGHLVAPLHSGKCPERPQERHTAATRMDRQFTTLAQRQ